MRDLRLTRTSGRRTLGVMTTLSCDMCSRVFTAGTFDDWFKQMYAHYMADHADVMAGMANKPKSEGAQWMAAAKARFDEAS